ncbi:MAG: metal-dependent hydrolase, partial [Bacteroidota bacterium]
MAGYRGHITGATAFFVPYLAGLLYLFSVDAAYLQFNELELIGYPLALFGLCLMFGLWPDVDTNSMGQNIFYTIFFLVDVVLIVTRNFQEAAYLGLFAILPVLGKHRGWTHQWWAMILVPSPLLILPYIFFPERPLAGLPFYGAALTGYFSHLFVDGLVVR